MIALHLRSRVASWRAYLGLLAAVAAATVAHAQTPLSAHFVYQGRLASNSVPVDSPAMPMTFTLYDSATGGPPLGGAINRSVPVVNGLFSVSLDFGAAAFSVGQQRWLEVVVDGTPLEPRQPLAAAPFALFSAAPWETSGADIFYAEGRVGVGTTTPSASLHVNGGVLARGGPPGASGANNNGYAFAYNGGDNDSGMFGTADGQVQFFTDGAERVRVAQSGRVGVGVTSPSASLHVAGGVLARGGVPGANGVNNNGYAFAFGGGDIDSGMFSSGDGQIEFYTQALERMRLMPNGRVGINTTAPLATLDVNGTARVSNLQVTSGAGSGKVLTSDAAGSASWQVPATAAQNLVEFGAAGSTTWTVPAGVSAIVVQVWGAGGSGGGGAIAGNGCAGGGGGGGAGAYARAFVAVQPGQQFQITVGAGGPPALAQTAGSLGGASSFATLGGAIILSADGGFGGSPGNGISGGGGGAGGNTTIGAAISRGGGAGALGGQGFLPPFSCQPGSGGGGGTPPVGVIPIVSPSQGFSRFDGSFAEMKAGDFPAVNSSGGGGGWGTTVSDGGGSQAGAPGYVAIFW